MVAREQSSRGSGRYHTGLYRKGDLSFVFKGDVRKRDLREGVHTVEGNHSYCHHQHETPTREKFSKH